MPSIETIELLGEVETYEGRLPAICACGHQGDIDVPAVIRNPRIPPDAIDRIGQWVVCRKCGSTRPTLRLTLPDGQTREYRRTYAEAH
ncbi:MAG: hypothetical protein KKB63_07590 [Alphaproteobacteria bacterium]|nr:hypothetical protein [Alphaproteobacteria bacterium]